MDDEMRGRLDDALARRDTPGRRAPVHHHPNREMPTPAQLIVVNAISHGLRAKEAAVVLGISYHTARAHIKHARERTASKTQEQLVAVCLRNHWIK